MEERIIGLVKRVNGPVIEAMGVTDARMLELVRVGQSRLVGEVVKLSGDGAVIQVYEDATGIAPRDPIFGSGMPMSVELGPGLLGTIYDGIQRPLEAIRGLSGHFIERGVTAESLDRAKRWHFVPSVQAGTRLEPGATIGTIQETSRIEHRVLAPPDVSGTLLSVAAEGDYTVTQTVATVRTVSGEVELPFFQRWPIRVPRPVARRLPLNQPLVSGQRVIDTLFPLAKGGTVAIPGGFGTGKTMTQHAIAKWCDADIIVYIGCGERGNEMTDVLTEFPKLVDPRTGKSLMERTILIANTSNMPVSAREASIYTGVTLAEYFRDQGYHVAVMADSTSRWAEALRELSGRMEEMPAEEGFPAYLPTRVAEFYERAGYMVSLGGAEGSVSIIGAVSPPGGDFSEPVTQHTKRFVRCFWGLDRQLANARHYPAISWLDSYSEYADDVKPWWDERVGPAWAVGRAEIMELLRREVRLLQVVKLVGPDALPDGQRFIIDVCSLFKNAFLQQNAFDDIDRYSSAEKQSRMLAIILVYWQRGAQAIKRGVPLSDLKRLKVIQEVNKMKFSYADDQLDELDRLSARLERAVDRLEEDHA
ncbi:MAG: V-type ATP synthase subunit A [Spirochaetes bacterium GWD1_61_31]|nr:MAG: V-type ATP synthase subunit A [Spirochaetes bacterium GWB1_60_80]OHD32745.1 MAG: V-type ATP synthase subunit A [Spirochaetes bacterium GWC1_61_12]OHD40611.1 MAG: V-type ATP synthase subunit A [Spirochaetes bacterium GWD1_61_31]OHD43883.1 MAG: V-type ATP synthase subunit A [Spirochaetes bacterium GWE1_60_18]OHD59754.1 MAG: V-type ATP synthase subunit A [Spirochaetes bacterium GWF1_60_12]HAP43525.1 V-type ATP synthase subunit A [Spirochaetaceae bacterium]